MERFKAVEREMKTKAFSKEGLSAAAKLDPKEQEKADGAQFLSDMVDELGQQIETLEAEKESLEVTVKKGKKDTGRADRVSEITRLCEKHSWHQTKLEQLNRALQNGNVDVEQLNDVKEGIKYYVEENQTPEFVEDDDLYEDFDLDAEDANYGIGTELDKVSSHDGPAADEGPDSSTAAPVSGAKQKGPADTSSSSARRPSNQLKSPLPALATLHSSATAGISSIGASAMKPAPLPARAPGETLKYASAAAAAAASEKGGIAPLPPPPGSLQPVMPLPAATSATAAAARRSPAASPATVPSVPVQPIAPINHHKPSIALSDAGASVGRSPTMSTAATSSMPPTPALEKSETASSAKSKAMHHLATTDEAVENSPSPEQPHTPPTLVATEVLGSAAAGNGEPAIEGEEESIYHLPSGLQELLQSFEITKERVNADPSPAASRLLDASQASCPEPLDGERPFHYRPQNRYMTPPHYPQTPSPIINDPVLYGRIDTDTLFFVFYYRQNTYQQYMAAKALKSQSWRFHKQYQTWFQRHEEPKTITEEYEQGTYRFFDYESTW